VGGVCIDVGAHKGAYTYWMARRVGSRGTVFAIEPQNRLIGPLNAAFAGMRQVRVVEAAASDRSAESVLMSIRRDSTHGASLDGLEGEGVDTASVRTVSLDDFLQSQAIGRLDFVKIDAEGHELRILAGAMRLLERFRPPVLAEIEARHHPGETDPVGRAVASLAPLDYRVEFYFGGAWRDVSQFDAARHQRYGHGKYVNNFLFVARR